MVFEQKMISSRPSKYEDALLNNIVTTEDGEYVSILEWIEQKIRTNKEFTVDMKYMKKILGPEFRKKNDDAIGVSLRSILEKYNIDLRRKLHHDGMKLIIHYLTG